MPSEPSRWLKFDEPIIYFLLALLLAANLLTGMQYREVAAAKVEVERANVEVRRANVKLAEAVDALEVCRDLLPDAPLNAR